MRSAPERKSQLGARPNFALCQWSQPVVSKLTNRPFVAHCGRGLALRCFKSDAMERQTQEEIMMQNLATLLLFLTAAAMLKMMVRLFGFSPFLPMPGS